MRDRRPDKVVLISVVAAFIALCEVIQPIQANLLPGDPRLKDAHHHDHHHHEHHTEHHHHHLESGHDHHGHHGSDHHEHHHDHGDEADSNAISNSIGGLKKALAGSKDFSMIKVFKLSDKKANKARRVKNKKQTGEDRSPKRQGKKQSLISFNPFRIPRTSFTCKRKAPGYYADMETDCMVYHLCNTRGGQRAFFCPEGTRFNQRTLVCDHTHRVECGEASSFYHKNIVLHEESLRAGQRKNEVLRKRPRLSGTSPVIKINPKPSFVRGSLNGQLNFAPLFQKRQNKLKIEAFTTTTTTTTRKPELKRENLSGPVTLSGDLLPPEVEETDRRSEENPEKLQLLSHKKASHSVERFHKDPEQPSLSTENKTQKAKDDPSPRSPLVSPVQFVGRVMSPKELKALPDSPVVKIKSKDVNSRPRLHNVLVPPPSKPSRTLTPPDIPEKPRSFPLELPDEPDDTDIDVALPIQLRPPQNNPNMPAPLIWISPASLARSPMVSLRKLDNEVQVERALTMNFPALSKSKKVKRQSLKDSKCTDCLLSQRRNAWKNCKQICRHIK